MAYPEQSQTANISKCWNWFNAADQQRGQGEPSLIAGITLEIMREFAVEPRSIFVAGLSAGGAAAAIMGSTYPDLYAAVGIHSGLACGAASNISSAFAAMREGVTLARTGSPDGTGLLHVVPTIAVHGDRDTTVNPINADRVIARSSAAADLRVIVSRGKAEGGLAYTCSTHVDKDGRPILQQWVVHGAGHAWSGGSSAGSFTEPCGPDASREMIRFFFQQKAN